MTKKITDEMVHSRFCYWNEANRAYIPYTLEQLAMVHCRALQTIKSLEERVKGREATIEGLRRDIARLQEK